MSPANSGFVPARLGGSLPVRAAVPADRRRRSRTPWRAAWPVGLRFAAGAVALSAAAAGLAATHSCHSVRGDTITPLDVIEAGVPAAWVPENSGLGLSPAPGVIRWMTRAEWKRYLSPDAGPVEPVCFARETVALSAERIEAALRDSGPLAHAQVTILDFSRIVLPGGPIRFPDSGLTATGPSASHALLWRGAAEIGQGRTVPVWVKFFALVETDWVETLQDLPAGSPIAAASLAEKHGWRHLRPGERLLRGLDMAAGAIPIRRIPASAALTASMIRPAPLVRAGQTVRVRVDGAAALEFEAMARTGGQLGQSIAIRNPLSGRVFHAQVTGEGKATVHPRASL